MKTEKFKVTPLERAWILYDVGNSAFVLMIATLVPIFFNALAEAGDRTRATLGRLLDRMPRSTAGDAARSRRSRIEPSFGGASGP